MFYSSEGGLWIGGGKSNSQVQLLNLHFTYAHMLNDHTKTVRKVIL